MKDIIINNLFELWKHIGSEGQFLHSSKQYSSTKPSNNSWPGKVFELNESELNFKELYQKIELEELPNSIAVLENTTIENQLSEHHFKLKSTVKGMYLDLQEEDKPANDFISIEKVDDQ